jgi:hypothetical protein
MISLHSKANSNAHFLCVLQNYRPKMGEPTAMELDTRDLFYELQTEHQTLQRQHCELLLESADIRTALEEAKKSNEALRREMKELQAEKTEWLREREVLRKHYPLLFLSAVPSRVSPIPRPLAPPGSVIVPASTLTTNTSVWGDRSIPWPIPPAVNG